MSTSSRTAIVIPTWNNSRHLEITLESLLHMTAHENYRIIVVDNGSGLKTQRYLERCDATTVRLESNEGFIRGTNAGLKLVAPGENVCLLNDDVCIVDPDWLEKLESRLVDDVGAVGPVSNFVIGQQFMLRSMCMPVVHDVKFLVGFCMLISSEAFQKIGLLDERFGMGGCEDLDYSIRLRNEGYRLLVNRSAFVFHYGSMTMNRIEGYGPTEEKNRALLLEKWGQEVLSGLGEA